MAINFTEDQERVLRECLRELRVIGALQSDSDVAVEDAEIAEVYEGDSEDDLAESVDSLVFQITSIVEDAVYGVDRSANTEAF